MEIFGWGVALHSERYEALPSTLQVLADPDPRTGEPYKEVIPKDPWGNPYEYTILSDTEYRILSRGEDGQGGTEDDVVWPREEHPPSERPRRVDRRGGPEIAGVLVLALAVVIVLSLAAVLVLRDRKPPP